MLRSLLFFAGIAAALFAAGPAASATASLPPTEIERRLDHVDADIERILRDWNGVGIGIGVVIGDRLVFARGYGYRDLERRLPFTTSTLFPIGSNTKLFTAVAAGLLVQEGKLAWDRPVHDFVPSIRFHDDALTDGVTLRDMLAHRVGLDRYDAIWYRTRRTPADLFGLLRYLEPSAPLRSKFIYNNVVYGALGRVIELQSGKSYASFVRDRILAPLGMTSSVFSVDAMARSSNHALSYALQDGVLRRIPFADRSTGGAPAIGLVSSIDELSHWLIALMNDGMYDGRQVLPAAVLDATLQPVMPFANDTRADRHEILNAAYGMGRESSSYRGFLMTNHGGATSGFHSQVAFLPNEKIGVIVFTIGTHTSWMTNPIAYDLVERLLGLPKTPWEERAREEQQQAAARRAAREAPVAPGPAAHRPPAYAGSYEHVLYGVLQVELRGARLALRFLDRRQDLRHVAFERFDAVKSPPDDTLVLNFRTGRDGRVDAVSVRLDGRDVCFERRR